MKETEVLVVGAGPVGLMTSLVLRRHGASVELVERLPAPVNQSRAAVIQPRTLEHLERLGIEKTFVSSGVALRGATVHGPDDKLLARMSTADLPSAFDFLLGIGQQKTEHFLGAALLDEGITARRSIEVVGFRDVGDGVETTIREPNGTEEIIRSRYLVGCDGARSGIRKGLNLELEGETLDQCWITADVRIKGPIHPEEVRTWLLPGGFIFITAIDDERYRVVLGFAEMTREQVCDMGLPQIEAIFHKYSIPLHFYDPVWISPFNINTRAVPRMRVGNVFLAGDASHVHSPVGGQGMNTGLQDAFNLGWKLGYALRNKSGGVEPLLESYNEERHANAKRLLSWVGPATKTVTLTKALPFALRNLAVQAANRLGLTQVGLLRISELDLDYRKSPAVENLDAEGTVVDVSGFFGGHQVRAGNRAPDVAAVSLPDGSRRLFECWRGDIRCQVLIFSGASPEPQLLDRLRAEVAKLNTLPGNFLKAWLAADAVVEGANEFSDLTEEMHATYDCAKPTLFLIRPDGYIGLRSDDPSADACIGYLRRQSMMQ